jgi:hypothetical protein
MDQQINLRTTKLFFQPTMAEGEYNDLVEDIIITPFSRQTFKKSYTLSGEVDADSTNPTLQTQAPRSTANCTAGNAYYLLLIDLVFGATLALQT